jgi:hypothetical protein
MLYPALKCLKYLSLVKGEIINEVIGLDIHYPNRLVDCILVTLGLPTPQSHNSKTIVPLRARMTALSKTFKDTK